jgi:hypothetical protein
MYPLLSVLFWVFSSLLCVLSKSKFKPVPDKLLPSWVSFFSMDLVSVSDIIEEVLITADQKGECSPNREEPAEDMISNSQPRG